MPNILPTAFYNRPPEIVARELLGKIIVRKLEHQIVRGRIVETEGYLARGDEAAHGFGGKTKRNASLYKDAGHAYVHGMRQYFLLDIVTEEIGVPSSVLIRAVEPLQGIEYMKALRGIDVVEHLASGPGKFCIAFEINKELDGIDITNSRAPLYIEGESDSDPSLRIEKSGRIGISRAKDFPLRFWIKGNPYVSR